MTKNQRITLMAELWPGACRVKGWNANDRELRLRVLSEAVGRPLETANDINNTTDFDSVKSHLLAIFRPDDLNAQVEIAEQNRTRLFFAIRELAHELSPAWVDSAAFQSPYAAAIMRNIHGHTDPDRLSIKQLEQFRFTLSARLSSKRRKASAETVPEPTEPDPF